MPQPLCIPLRHFFHDTKGDLRAFGMYYYNGTHTATTPNKHECWDHETLNLLGTDPLIENKDQNIPSHHQSLATCEMKLTDKDIGPGVDGPEVKSWSGHRLTFILIYVSEVGFPHLEAEGALG